MSVNKVEMSLDDIIKANKGKNNKRGGASSVKRVVKRGSNITKFQQKGNGKRVQNKSLTMFKKKVINTRSQNNENGRVRPQKVNAIATKKLVQKLVKKALAQRNVPRIVRTKSILKPALRKRGGAVRYVKQTVMPINSRSRVITRNSRMNVRGREFATQQFLPNVSQVRFSTTTRPVIIKRKQPQITYVRQQQRKQQPQIIIREVRRPVFVQPRSVVVQRPSPNNYRRAGTSVRDQIAALRQQQQVVYVQRPKPQVTYVQQQVRKQQNGGRNRFQNQRKPQQQQKRAAKRNNDPFYEPLNFLQRF